MISFDASKRVKSMGVIDRFEELDAAKKADAIRAARDEFASPLTGAPKCAALIFFDQLISDVEAGRTESTSLTPREYEKEITERFPDETTPAATAAAPYRVAEALKDFVFPYPATAPRWELHFRGPTATGRKGARAWSRKLYLMYTAKPFDPDRVAKPSKRAAAGVAKDTATEASLAPTIDPPSTKRQNPIRLIALLLVGLVAVVFVYRWSRPAPIAVIPQPAQPSRPQPRKSVVVFSFQSNSGRVEDAWLSPAISEILSRALASGRSLRVVSREETLHMEADLALNTSQPIPTDVLSRIRRRTRGDFLVVGSFSVLGGAGPPLVNVDARLLDARTGSTLVTASAPGSQPQLFETVTRAAAPIRGRLGITELSPREKKELTASIPAKALRLYTEGLTHLRRFNARSAREILTQANAAEPNHPLILSALAQALTAHGLDVQARETIARARAHAGDLPSEQQTQIAVQFYTCEARFHGLGEEQKKDWQQAVNAQQALWLANQDDIEEGLELASLQIAANMTTDAFLTIAALRELSKPIADGRIDLVESRAHQEEGDSDKQITLAVSAAREGRAVYDRLLVGRARMLEATARIAHRELPAADAAIDEARRSFQAVGDLGSDARALEQTAESLALKGDRTAEEKLLRDLLTVYRELGDRGGVARVEVHLGYKYVREGKMEEAKSSIKNALAIYRTAGGPYQLASALSEFGALMFYTGDLQSAEKHYRDALTLSQSIPHPPGIAIALTNIAEVMSCRGDLKDALELHKKSYTINQGLPGRKPDTSGMAYDLVKIGEILALQGDRLAAENRFLEALKIQEHPEHLERLEAEKTRVTIARLLTEDGNPAYAAKIAEDMRRADEILRVGGEADSSALARAILAQALLLQGKQKEAAETSRQAWHDVERSGNRLLRFAVAIAHARALAGSNDKRQVAEALDLLERMRTEAQRKNLAVAALEIGLAMAEIELKAGISAGRNRLADIKQAAEAKDIGYVARRAAAHLGESQ